MDMDLKTITIERRDATIAYREYRDALRQNLDVDYLRDLRDAYGHAKRGHPILDVWQAFRDTGLDENTDPKIAIARADMKQVTFLKYNHTQRRDDGTPSGTAWCGGFISDRADRRTLEARVEAGNVYVPQGTWAQWKYPASAFQKDGQLDRWGRPWRGELQTSVPIIPPRFIPPTGLHSYHVLWEVEKWDVVTPPRDPLLLKRVSPNVFGVLAAWDLTDLERAVLRGRIG